MVASSSSTTRGTEAGRGFIVVLDRGARDGLEVGNVLAIYHPAPVIPDPRPYEGPDVFSKLSEATKVIVPPTKFLNVPPERSGSAVRVPRVRPRRLRDSAQYGRTGCRRRHGAQALEPFRYKRPMEIDARVEAWASLQLLPRVSARALVALLKAFGGPAQVLAASPAMLAKVVPAETAAAIARGPDPATLEQTLAWLREPGHALVAWDDPAYPHALLTHRRSTTGPVLCTVAANC